MAGEEELHSFYMKFINLWKSGRHAKLFVETIEGNAFINLQVGLGQAQPHSSHHAHVGGHRAGGTARQRRRERREEARHVIEATEKAAGIKVTAEQVPPKDDMKVESGKDAKDTNEAVEEIAVSSSPIPQLDGAFSEILSTNIEYKLTMESHPEVTSDDIKEAIVTNFNGLLDDTKIHKNDNIRNLTFKKAEVKDVIENKGRVVKDFTITVRDNAVVKDTIESWKERYQFDELAFENFNFDGKSTRVSQVQKMA